MICAKVVSRDNWLLCIVCKLLIIGLPLSYARDSTFYKEKYVKRAGSWFLADVVDNLDQRADQHYISHNRTKPYAQGLPEGCITFKERYKNYLNISEDFGQANERNLTSEYAILVRVHYGLQWNEDLVLAMRALVAESEKAGWHVWLIHQETTEEAPLQDAGPAQILSHIPQEFQLLLQSFTAEELHQLYPKAHNFVKSHFGYVPDRQDYMGPLWFLHRYPYYKFAFVMEYDVRYIGDWGLFFSNALQLAMKTMHSQKNLLHETVPDVILFTDAIYHALPPDGPDNGVRATPQWKFPNAMKEMVVIFGLSQKTVTQMHKHSKEGNSGYIEEFIPTLAAHENLNTVLVPLGEWNGEETLHCCSNLGASIYEEWIESDSCHAFTLLHPVKYSKAHFAVSSE